VGLAGCFGPLMVMRTKRATIALNAGFVRRIGCPLRQPQGFEAPGPWSIAGRSAHRARTLGFGTSRYRQEAVV